jgi:hypothetical protein
MRWELYQRRRAEWIDACGGYDEDIAKVQALGKALRAQALQAQARLRASPTLQQYYEQRQVAPMMGRDPDTVKRVNPRSLAYQREQARKAAMRVTPEQQLEREADSPELSIEEWAQQQREEAYSPADRRPEAIQQRRDYAAYVRRHRHAVSVVTRARSAQLKREQELEAKFLAQFTQVPAAAAVHDTRWKAMTAKQKVLADLDTIARRGRSIPMASRHPAAGVPLWLRRGVRR